MSGYRQTIGFPKWVADNILEDLQSTVYGGTKQTLGGNLLGKHISLKGYDYCGSRSTTSVLVDYLCVSTREELKFWTSDRMLIRQLQYLKNYEMFPTMVRIVKSKGFYKFE